MLMKVAIFNHPLTDFYCSPQRINAGILTYLAKIIAPHTAWCCDVIKKYKKKIALPDAINYLHTYRTDDQSEYTFFNEYYQFGDKTNFNHKQVKRFDPEVIIITSFAFCYYDSLVEFARYLKEYFGQVPLICGGAGPSSHPGYYLRDGIFDYVVVGPAELSLKRLLDELAVNNESIRLPNVFHRNDPDPLIDLDKPYRFAPHINIKKNTIQMQLTRGCPKKCTYCSIKLTYGSAYQKAALDDIENIINRLELNEGKKIYFNFEDDNVTLDLEYFKQVLIMIKRRYPGAVFSAENGIDFVTLDHARIHELIKAGFNQFNLSLASTNVDVLHKSRRDYTPVKMDAVLDVLQASDILVIVYFISGLPGDTVVNIIKTIMYLAAKKCILGISNFYPVPGTVDAEKISGEIIPEQAKGTSFYPWFSIGTQTLVTFFMLSRFINAIKKIEISEWDAFGEITIRDDEIITKSALSRRMLTMIGIINSLYHKKLYAVTRVGLSIRLRSYLLDKSVLAAFFERFDAGEVTIMNQKGDVYTYEFWSKQWKKVFR